MKRIFAICFCSLLLATAAQATVRYVSTTGDVNNTGLGSWRNACSDLQAMINASASGDEVWVAAGTYYPTKMAYTDYDGGVIVTVTDRDKAFVLKDGVKVYGGFPDTRYPSFADRDWKTYVTILSGDLDENDDVDSYNTLYNATSDERIDVWNNPAVHSCFDDNAYHVVIAAGIGSGTELDGFTITGGVGSVDENQKYRATVNEIDYIVVYGGGGIINRASSAIFSNLKITRNISGRGGGVYSEAEVENTSAYILKDSEISNNLAFSIQKNANDGHGAGIYNYESSATYTRIHVIGNKGLMYDGCSGGGIYNQGGWDDSRTISITDSKILNNEASWGGGIANRISDTKLSTITLHNVLIKGNHGSAHGGGVFNADNHLTMTNVAIVDNKSYQGGGFYENGGKASAKTTLTNVTISNNLVFGETNGQDISAQGVAGGGIYYKAGASAYLTVNNSIVWGNRRLFTNTSTPPYNVDETHNFGNNNLGNKFSCSNLLTSGYIPQNPGTGGLPVPDANNDNIIDADPRFALDYHLQFSSPARDTGADQLYETTRGITGLSTETDLAGSARLVGDFIDLGAYEHPSATKGTLTAPDFTFAPARTVYTGDPQPVTVTPKSHLFGVAASDIDTIKYQDVFGTDLLTKEPPTDAGFYKIIIYVKETDNYFAADSLVLEGTYVIAEDVYSARVNRESINFGNVGVTYTVPAPDTVWIINTGSLKAQRVTVSLDRGEAFVLLNRAGEEVAELLSGVNYIDVGSWDSIAVQPKPNLRVNCHTDTLRVRMEFETAPGIWRDLTVKTALLFCVEAAFSQPNPTLRRVTLPSIAGITTFPPAGWHYVSAGVEFVFTLIPNAPLPASGFPIVSTNRTDRTLSNDVTVSQPNADGTYTVTVHEVYQDVILSLGLFTSNEAIASAKVWSHDATLYIYAPADGTAQVYRLTGQLVTTLPLTAGETVQTTLPQGVYIVVANGQASKVIIES